MHNVRTLKLKQLNRIHPSIILLLTPLLFTSPVEKKGQVTFETEVCFSVWLEAEHS